MKALAVGLALLGAVGIAGCAARGPRPDAGSPSPLPLPAERGEGDAGKAGGDVGRPSPLPLPAERGEGDAGKAGGDAGRPSPLPLPAERGEGDAGKAGGDAGRPSPPPLPAERGEGDAAAPLPPPLPPPDLGAPPPAHRADPLDVLWAHRLDFGEGGEPLVTIRLMEGQREIAFRPLGPARAVLRGGGAVEVPAGAHLRVRARGALPARLSWAVVLADAPLAARARLEPLRAHYAERGVATATRTTGGVFGLGGRVVDNRRELLVAAGPDDEAGARDLLEELRVRHGARPVLHAELARRPEGTLLLSAAGGGPLGEAEGAVALDVPGGEGFVVEAVEHDLGPKGRAREDRRYRGRLYVTVDAGGDLAAVHGVPLEELLRGLVPSEMPASSPMAALRAQAVTARSNVLAQLGTRHLVDPFMLCAEVHCQAYRGDGATNPRTDEAVRATRGEALFGKDGQLVDAVYSALCGGHGEDNDKVWGNAPSPSLRGRPDLPPKAAARWAGGLADEARLRAFLAEEQEGWCRRAPGARRDRWRWERTLSAAALDAQVAPLAVGPRATLEVASRGVSGRARLLRVTGSEGSAEISGELRIRRLLGNLPSAMFVVDPAVEGDGVVLRGGGWGHGAGMCQWGAVGRASAGHDHRAILRAYFSGAEVVKVY